MSERDVIERTLQRFRYRSLTDVLTRYNAPICHVWRWRQAEPAFPPPIRIVGEREPFFAFFPLIRWEIDFQRRRRRLQ
jgi:hypothetical protein